jgi:hypothetical protein
MTFSLWLLLFSFAVAIFPHLFILKKFEKENAYPFGKGSFQTFQIVDIVWSMACILFFGRWIARASNSSESFSLFAMFFSLITIPTAVYSSFTGIYSARTRRGFYYYEKYKNPAKQFRKSSKFPELKIVGWIQLFFLIGIAGVSIIYVFR